MEQSLLCYPVEWFTSSVEDFICVFCSKVLNDTLQCKNGHMFCRNCVHNAYKTSRLCPTCDVQLILGELGNNKLADKQISKLTTFCPCMIDSSATPPLCGWTGSLTERLLRHCEFQSKECPNTGCSLQLPDAAISEHILDCNFRIVQCDACDMDVRFCDCGEHATVCAQRKTVCVCGDSVIHSKLEQHKEFDCTMSLVDCPLFLVECCTDACSGKILRGELNTHITAVSGSENVEFILKLVSKIPLLKNEKKTNKDKLQATENAVRSDTTSLSQSSTNNTTSCLPAVSLSAEDAAISFESNFASVECDSSASILQGSSSPAAPHREVISLAVDEVNEESDDDNSIRDQPHPSHQVIDMTVEPVDEPTAIEATEQEVSATEELTIAERIRSRKRTRTTTSQVPLEECKEGRDDGWDHPSTYQPGDETQKGRALRAKALKESRAAATALKAQQIANGTVVEGSAKKKRRGRNNNNTVDAAVDPNAPVLNENGDVIRTFEYGGVGLYVGTYSDIDKYGVGIMTYLNGDVYSGGWRHDERGGQGKQEYKDSGRVYEGRWNNKQTGEGVMTYKSGKVYKGVFQKDKREGEGTLFDPQGEILFRGHWSNDKAVPDWNPEKTVKVKNKNKGKMGKRERATAELLERQEKNQVLRAQEEKLWIEKITLKQKLLAALRAAQPPPPPPQTQSSTRPEQHADEQSEMHQQNVVSVIKVEEALRRLEDVMKVDV